MSILGLFGKKEKPKKEEPKAQQVENTTLPMRRYVQAESPAGMERVPVVIGTYKPSLDGIAALKASDKPIRDIDLKENSAGYSLFANGKKCGAIFDDGYVNLFASGNVESVYLEIVNDRTRLYLRTRQ